MVISTQLHGMHNYMERLRKIAEACGEKRPKEKETRDAFQVQKVKMYQMLQDVRNNTRSRHELMAKRGNCHESINRGHTIRKQLEELKRMVAQLQEMHKKAQNKSSARKAENKEELKSRYEDIRNLKRLIDEANDMFSNSAHQSWVAGVGNGPPGPTLFGLRGAGDASAHDKRDMEDDERNLLKKWRGRNENFDTMLEQIGNGLDILKNQTQEIGFSAGRQTDTAERLTVDVSVADEELKKMHKRIDEVMRYEKNTNLFCQLILGVALFCCIGFVVQQLKVF